MNQKFHDHFSGVAAKYADFRPHYPAALFDYLASLAPADSTVWDCATGNGQAAADLAARFRRVIATDASKDQIAAANPRANVEYRVAPAEESSLPDGAVSMVTVAQAMHWFDLPKFYAEVKRVLQPGGILAAWAYGINEVEGAEVNALVQDYYSNVVGPYWPPERKLVEDGYRAVPFPFIEITPPAFQMEVQWTMDELIGYFGTWSATSRFIKAKGFNPLEALAVEMEKVWSDPQSVRRVIWPLAVKVGRA